MSSEQPEDKRIPELDPVTERKDGDRLLIHTAADNIDHNITVGNFLKDIMASAGPDAPGSRGWAPVFGIANNGAERVLQLIDYVDGQLPKPDANLMEYVGSDGYVEDINDAIDIRGPTGADSTATGQTGQTGATGWAPAYALEEDGATREVLKLVNWIGTATTDAPAGVGMYVATAGLVASKTLASNLKGATGAVSTVPGPRGWAPIYTASNDPPPDGARRVLQLTDYVGGELPKPNTHIGMYLGPGNTFVTTSAAAVDVRGPAGEDNTSQGAAGQNAWEPVFELTADPNDAAKIYMRITGWINGEGPRPEIGYLGTTGITPGIVATTTNLRGAPGINVAGAEGGGYILLTAEASAEDRPIAVGDRFSFGARVNDVENYAVMPIGSELVALGISKHNPNADTSVTVSLRIVNAIQGSVSLLSQQSNIVQDLPLDGDPIIPIAKNARLSFTVDAITIPSEGLTVTALFKTPGIKGDKGDPGTRGWSPEFALHEYTDAMGVLHQVVELVAYHGGTGDPPLIGVNKYVGEEGLVSTPQAAISIRGTKGDTGAASMVPGEAGHNGWNPIFAIIPQIINGAATGSLIVNIGYEGGGGAMPVGGFLGPGGILSGHAGAVNIKGADGMNGTHGTDGTNGWTPILRVVDHERTVDGEDITAAVIQILDWVGSTGTKPAVGYLSDSAVESDIANGTNIRGMDGADGENASNVPALSTGTNNQILRLVGGAIQFSDENVGGGGIELPAGAAAGEYLAVNEAADGIEAVSPLSFSPADVERDWEDLTANATASDNEDHSSSAALPRQATSEPLFVRVPNLDQYEMVGVIVEDRVEVPDFPTNRPDAVIPISRNVMPTWDDPATEEYGYRINIGGSNMAFYRGVHDDDLVIINASHRPASEGTERLSYIHRIHGVKKIQHLIRGDKGDPGDSLLDDPSDLDDDLIIRVKDGEYITEPLDRIPTTVPTQNPDPNIENTLTKENDNLRPVYKSILRIPTPGNADVNKVLGVIDPAILGSIGWVDKGTGSGSGGTTNITVSGWQPVLTAEQGPRGKAYHVSWIGGTGIKPQDGYISDSAVYNSLRHIQNRPTNARDVNFISDTRAIVLEHTEFGLVTTTTLHVYSRNADGTLDESLSSREVDLHATQIAFSDTVCFLRTNTGIDVHILTGDSFGARVARQSVVAISAIGTHANRNISNVGNLFVFYVTNNTTLSTFEYTIATQTFTPRTNYGALSGVPTALANIASGEFIAAFENRLERYEVVGASTTLALQASHSHSFGSVKSIYAYVDSNVLSPTTSETIYLSGGTLYSLHRGGLVSDINEAVQTIDADFIRDNPASEATREIGRIFTPIKRIIVFDGVLVGGFAITKVPVDSTNSLNIDGLTIQNNIITLPRGKFYHLTLFPALADTSSVNTGISIRATPKESTERPLSEWSTSSFGDFVAGRVGALTRLLNLRDATVDEDVCFTRDANSITMQAGSYMIIEEAF